MRKYEISCTVICQSITQLKGMYPDDYEVVDANCPQTIFLGGDENSNNEYISKKIGMATVKGMNDSVDNKKVNLSYNVEQKELMRPEDLGRIPFEDEIVLIYGEDPIYDKKYDYPRHKNYQFTHDYAMDLGITTGSMFDRSCFAEIETISLKYHAETPVSVSSVHELTKEAFLSICGSTDIQKAGETQERRINMQNNFKRFSYDEDDTDNIFVNNSSETGY